MTIKELLDITEITRRVHIAKVKDDEDGMYTIVCDEKLTPKPLLFPDILLSYLKNKNPQLLEAEVIMVSYRFWDDGKPFIEYIIK